MKRIVFSIILFFSILSVTYSQYPLMDKIPAEVDFSKKIRLWDGFGFNYVETCQTYDYNQDPQEYGGFSILNEQDRQKVIDMVFGEDGLKVSLLKMFYDPFHQPTPTAGYDHKSTTHFIRSFAQEGYKKTKERGADLQIITTLYGPPAWATLQQKIRGRDINPEQLPALADYLVDWARFLKDEEKLPIKYISIHNEGEDWSRWPADGKDPNIGSGHDYNMYWSPYLVADFMPLLREKLNKAGLSDIGVTPGENTNWFRFYHWGYAPIIAANPAALDAMDLITSHGFYVGNYGPWFGEHCSAGIDMLRELRPELHAWVTSTSWSKMDAKNIKEMHGNIYTSKVNGIIPWAGIQRPEKWVGGDPNPGSAFTVYEDGRLEVRRGYYFYKQISRAGQPGMAVAQAFSLNSEVVLIAFSANGTTNKDAFVVINYSDKDRGIEVKIKGTDSFRFDAFRTDEQQERYTPIGNFSLTGDKLIYIAPAGSVTTFFAQ